MTREVSLFCQRLNQGVFQFLVYLQADHILVHLRQLLGADLVCLLSEEGRGGGDVQLDIPMRQQPLLQGLTGLDRAGVGSSPGSICCLGVM